MPPKRAPVIEPMSGHLPVRQHEIAGLHGGASFFGGLLQIVFGLGAIGEFLRLLREQRRRPARS